MTDEELLEAIEAQRLLMIAVATGGPRIDDVNAEYVQRRRLIERELARRGIENANPHSDLWRWYGKWSSGDFPTYQSRRGYISELFEPLIDRLTTRASERMTVVPDEPTGWERVDRVMDAARRQLEIAANEEGFQQVGLLCREILISLAQAVYDPNLHPALDDKKPSHTDAKRMLEAYIAHELGGGDYYTPRKYAKSALDLANYLQHKRTAQFRDAALCAEATASVVNIIAIVSGRRDPLRRGGGAGGGGGG